MDLMLRKRAYSELRLTIKIDKEIWDVINIVTGFVKKVGTWLKFYLVVWTMFIFKRSPAS